MSPFDAARYSRLLKGLDIAEVMASQLEFSGRLDSEYYQPAHLAAEARVRERGSQDLASICSFLIGPFGSAFTVENYCESQDYRYIRGKDVKPMVLQDDDNVYMPKADFDRLSKYALRSGDVLVSVVGTVGNSALVGKKDLPAIFSCKSTVLRNSKIDSRYLISYLNCKYGHGLLTRKERGAVQKGLNLDDLRTLSVFVGTPALQLKVAEIYEAAIASRAIAKQKIAQAESMLLNAMGMKGWRAPEPLTYVRRSGEVTAADRLDAQHFQPRFQALTDFIDATGQGAKLADWLNEIQRGKQPDYSEDGLPVINSKHVLRGEVQLDEDNRRASFVESDLLIHEGDVLMNGTGVGTIGRAAPYFRPNESIPDNHVTILRPKTGLDAVYLSVFLNSMAGQWQVEQRLRGSSGQIELYPADIAQFRIWIAPKTTQANIHQAVVEGYEKKQDAIRLLAATKRAVEIAIEECEDAAINFLEKFK